MLPLLLLPLLLVNPILILDIIPLLLLVQPVFLLIIIALLLPPGWWRCRLTIVIFVRPLRLIVIALLLRPVFIWPILIAQVFRRAALTFANHVVHWTRRELPPRRSLNVSDVRTCVREDGLLASVNIDRSTIETIDHPRAVDNCGVVSDENVRARRKTIAKVMDANEHE